MSEETSDRNSIAGARKRQKLGVEALAAVLEHEELEELTKLRAEVRRLRILEALQVKTAVHKDIHNWFNRINDPNDTTTTIDTLKEMRDFILDDANTVEFFYNISDRKCRFSTVGGHHELMAAILKACQRYDEALARTGGGDDSLVDPMDWQWEPSKAPAHLCANPCINLDHLTVEDRNYTATRYSVVKKFPTARVEAAAKRQDVGFGS